MMIAHQRQRQIDDAPRDAAMAHQRPGQHEQRNGHQRKRIHRGEQPLPEQRHRIALVEDAPKPGERDAEGYRQAQNQKQREAAK